MVSEAPGLAVGGRELSTPPASVQRLLAESHVAGHVQPLSVRVLTRQRVPTQYLLAGEHLLTLDIESKGSR